MKKIAIISHGLSNGGAEKVSSIIANYLAQKGYQIIYIAVYSEKREYRLEKNIEYRYIEVNNKNKLKKFIKRSKLVSEYINNFNPDIIISFICNETIFINKRYPIIYTLRNDPKRTEKNIIHKNLRNYLYNKKAKKIVFQTEDEKLYFSDKIRKKGVVIYNPIDTNNMPDWENFEHQKRIITACRLTKQKNIGMLISAFEIFYNKHDEYILEIYGEGEEKENIQNMIKEKKLENHVFLKGRNDKILEIMAKSTVFVLSSDYEGLSNSMLEALCVGVPTICTDCKSGGARIFIENGKNGFLVGVGDKNELSERLIQLVEDEEKMKNFSKESKRCKEILSIDKICIKWENILVEE